MSDVEFPKLPKGWMWTSLDSICEINPRTWDTPLTNDEMVSFVPMAAVEAGTGLLDPSQERPWGELRDKSYTKFHEGDILFAKVTPCMENGKIAVASGLRNSKGVGSTEFHVLRCSKLISNRYLLHYLLRETFRAEAEQRMSGAVGLRRVPTSFLRDHAVPLPPLAEQRRIVEILDDHLSRLDAATTTLDRAGAWGAPLRRSLLAQLRNSAMIIEGKLTPLGAVAYTALGKMLDSKKNTGTETPYLRNINVRWGKFDLENVSTLLMKETEKEKYALAAGDLLVCEGGEPGRCAVWPGSAGVMTYQKALHRVRPSDKVSPHWLALMIEEAVCTGRTRRMLTGTTIKHLPQERLRQLEIPVPPRTMQSKLIDDFTSVENHTDRMLGVSATMRSRANQLRRALLNRAFSGRLVAQDATDEPASVLLDRIRAERASQSGGGKASRNSVRSRSNALPTDVPPPPSATPFSTQNDAVQQELPL